MVLIVPVRGPAPGLKPCLDALCGQDWPVLRILVVLESEDDPAAGIARATAAADPRVTVVQAGEALDRGQKVHNLLAGLRQLEPADDLVVFVDADAVPPPDFLRVLLRPILRRRARLASGYRVLVPASGRMGACLAALADHAVATMPRFARRMILWGGATAIRSDALTALDPDLTWRGALSDDLTLTLRARAIGERMHGVHACLLPTPVSYTLPEAFRFGVRQLRLLRLHLPFEWAVVGFVSVVPALGAGLAAIGHPAAVAAAVLAFVALQVRLSLRRRIFALTLPPSEAEAVARAIRWGRFVFPIANALRLACWVGSAFGRRIAWAGITYEVGPPDRVRIVARRPPAAHPRVRRPRAVSPRSG